MNRRNFLISSSLAAAGGMAAEPRQSQAQGARVREFGQLAAIPIPEAKVEVTAFGARPDSGADATAAFRRAAARCQELKRARLLIPPGTYEFKDELALRHFDDLMAGKLNPVAYQFGENIDFARAMEFKNLEGLVIEAAGARLVFHGLTQPLALVDCRNVLIKGLSIDWARPLFSTAEITSVSAGELEIKIDDQYPIRGGEPAYTFMIFDRASGDLGATEAYCANCRIEPAGSGRFRIRNPQAFRFRPGQGLVIRHIIYRPAIHLYQGRNLRFQDLTICGAPSFGILAHRSADLSLERVKVAPGGHGPMSINGDATHFISCRGEIRLQGCDFSRMGDDGINVHGFYQTVLRRLDRRTLVCTMPHLTQDLRYDFPDRGAEIELVRPATLCPYWSARVAEADTDEAAKQTRLVLDRDLPWNFRRSDYLMDVSRLPALWMRGCRVFNNRARAALVQTRGVVIEDCRFERCTGTGIHVNTAVSWLESGATRDVAIRNNRILGCGFGPGAYLGASAVAVGVESVFPKTGVHQRITIQNNEIEAGGRKAIQLSCVEDVLLEDNRIGNAGRELAMTAAGKIRKD